MLGFVKKGVGEEGGAYDGSEISSSPPGQSLARYLVVVKFKQGTYRLRATQVEVQEDPDDLEDFPFGGPLSRRTDSSLERPTRSPFMSYTVSPGHCFLTWYM